MRAKEGLGANGIRQVHLGLANNFREVFPLELDDKKINEICLAYLASGMWLCCRSLPMWVRLGCTRARFRWHGKESLRARII